jgi:uncharacterized protein (TIGR00255 family)
MMISMTAFGSAEMTFDEFTVFVEIRSYNSRYLDISLNIPAGIRQFEDKAKSLISSRMSRGRVEVKVKLEEKKNLSDTFELDMDRARSYSDAILKLKEELDMDITIPVDFLTGAGRILLPTEHTKDADIIWEGIEKCMLKAIDGLEEMRKEEGLTISRDLSMRLDYMETVIGDIKNASKDLLLAYQNKLKGRIEDLTKGMVEIDLDRIAQEAAFLADKSDISEEIVRIESHINQFRGIQNSDEPAGRKINFLLQELGREINTIGSKTGKADVSHMVVDVKSELEKIREQIQNIE